MILNIYVYRDKKLGCYDKPLFEKDDKEQFSEQIVRSVKKSTEQDKPFIIDKALYYLGQYDDIKGVFLLLDHEEKLLDLEDYLPVMEKKDA